MPGRRWLGPSAPRRRSCVRAGPAQDELLGLEQQDETWAGIDPGVLFTFAEDAQVPQGGGSPRPLRRWAAAA